MLSLAQTKNRYIRQTIIPEIDDNGQQKLLNSSIIVCGMSAKDTAPMLYYLAATGIGHIYFNFQDNNGINEIILNLNDLNPDVYIENVETDFDKVNFKTTPLAKIIIGHSGFINEYLDSANFKLTSIPNIIALYGPWQGSIQVVKSKSKPNIPTFTFTSFENSFTKCGFLLASFFVGALAAVEAVKIIVNAGNLSEQPLYFNLLTLEFNNSNNATSNNNCDKDTITTFRENLSKGKALLIGTGGLGSPVAYALTAAGINTLGLVDSDVVDMTNLNRQILHSTSRIGQPKVKSAEYFLKKLNPNINIITYETFFSKENAINIIKDYDIIISCLDNITSRYLLNDACYFEKKPLVEGAILRFDGINMTIIPHESQCYRCIFPDKTSSKSKIGVLGPVPGVIGFIQAAEAIKLLTETGKVLKNKLLLFSGLNMKINILGVSKDPDCPLCGKNPTITELKEGN